MQTRSRNSLNASDHRASDSPKADESGMFPPSTKCYHGEDMVGDSEGDGRYEAKPEPKIIHNIRPRLSMNQPLHSSQALASTSMEQIEGKLCRVEMAIDTHFVPGDPAMKQLVDAFSALEAVDPAALELIEKEEERTRLTVETCISNLMAHAGELMSRKAPCKLRFHSIPSLTVDIVIEPSKHDGEEIDRPGIHDQCWVNGVSVGNRCGAVSAFGVLAAPVLAAYFRMAADVHPAAAKPTKADPHPNTYWSEMREKLYASKPKEK